MFINCKEICFRFYNAFNFFVLRIRSASQEFHCELTQSHCVDRTYSTAWPTPIMHYHRQIIHGRETLNAKHMGCIQDDGSPCSDYYFRPQMKLTQPCSSLERSSTQKYGQSQRWQLTRFSFFTCTRRGVLSFSVTEDKPEGAQPQRTTGGIESRTQRSTSLTHTTLTHFSKHRNWNENVGNYNRDNDNNITGKQGSFPEIQL